MEDDVRQLQQKETTGDWLMDKDLFNELWEKTESTFKGVQVIDSQVLDRPIKYYIFPYKDGVPIITLHDDEWRIMSDKVTHKRVLGEIINKVTENL